jgi:hypothetical protein
MQQGKDDVERGTTKLSRASLTKIEPNCERKIDNNAHN